MKIRATKFLAAAAAVALAATMSSVVGSQAASAAPSASVPTFTTLIATSTVTTADKHSWTLTLVDDQFGSSSKGSNSLDIRIQRSISKAGGGYEAHEWTALPGTKSFSFSSSSRKGTLNTGSSVSPLASLDLAFVGKAPTKPGCSTGSGSIYAGSLTGKLTLKTGLTKGGTISAVKFTGVRVVVSNGCELSGAGLCDTGVDFFGYKGDALAVNGYSNDGAKSALLSVSRYVTLTAPDGARRTDEGGLLTGPLPTFNASTKKLTVKTETSGALTGSAVLSGGKKDVESSTCKVGTKKYTLTDTSYFGATLTSPTASPLTAHTTLTGALAMPASLKGVEFDVTTRK